MRSDRPSRATSLRLSRSGATFLHLGASWLVVLALAGCATSIPAPTPHVDPGFAAYSDANDDARLVKVTEHVYAAVGFDIGNIGFVVTD